MTQFTSPAPPCGTTGAARRHQMAGEVCSVCRDAERERSRRYQREHGDRVRLRQRAKDRACADLKAAHPEVYEAFFAEQLERFAARYPDHPNPLYARKRANVAAKRALAMEFPLEFAVLKMAHMQAMEAEQQGLV